MGGLGSGRYGHKGSEVRKWSVDEVCYLDIQTLKGSLDGETLKGSWDNGKFEVSILTKKDHIIISYSTNTKQINTKIDIDSTRVGYGSRLWFKCPGCKKRKGRVYFASNVFSCRDCHQLTYLTCQASGDQLRYLALKIRHLQRKLGLDGDDIHELPLFKPKYMHWQTFSTLRTKLELMQLARLEEWIKECR
jgi:hypothetical protein